MLIVIVSVFATMWLPYRVMVVYNSFVKTKYLDIWFLLFCRVMVYINSSINPILYNAMSAKFRREFQKILSCGTLRYFSCFYFKFESTKHRHSFIESQIHWPAFYKTSVIGGRTCTYKHIYLTCVANFTVESTFFLFISNKQLLV